MNVSLPFFRKHSSPLSGVLLAVLLCWVAVPGVHGNFSSDAESYQKKLHDQIVCQFNVDKHNAPQLTAKDHGVHFILPSFRLHI